MPEQILLQIGQAGNQIGAKFWECALKEHAALNNGMKYTQAEASYFKNTEEGTGTRIIQDANQPDGKIQALKARAVMIDMESSVIHSIIKTHSLRSLFSQVTAITDQPGSGNNWATGYKENYPAHKEDIDQAIRDEMEAADCLGSVMLLHSTGGGTGAGVGTAITEDLDFKRKINVCVVPRGGGDVVTGAYNTLFTVSRVTAHTELFIPVENDALFSILDTHTQKSRTQGVPFQIGGRKVAVSPTKVNKSAQQAQAGVSKKAMQGWDEINGFIANVILDMTSSSRFPGSLNVDMSDLATNLVPYPITNSVLCTATPLSASVNFGAKPLLWTEVFSPKNCLVRADKGFVLATALLCRGAWTWGTVRENVDRISRSRQGIPSWKGSGGQWKVGVCAAAPRTHSHSLLSLQNSTSIVAHFEDISKRASSLWKRKAHVHHYTSEGIELDEFVWAFDNIREITEAYKALETEKGLQSSRTTHLSLGESRKGATNVALDNSTIKKISWCEEQLVKMNASRASAGS